MSKIFALLAIVLVIVMCNKKDESAKATFVKICKYGTDSVLNCNTYFFSKLDSPALDSLYKADLSNESYIETQPNQHYLRYLQKDTIVLLVK